MAEEANFAESTIEILRKEADDLRKEAESLRPAVVQLNMCDQEVSRALTDYKHKASAEQQAASARDAARDLHSLRERELDTTRVQRESAWATLRAAHLRRARQLVNILETAGKSSEQSAPIAHILKAMSSEVKAEMTKVGSHTDGYTDFKQLVEVCNKAHSTFKAQKSVRKQQNVAAVTPVAAHTATPPASTASASSTARPTEAPAETVNDATMTDAVGLQVKAEA